MDVPLCVPDVTDTDVARVVEVLRSGWLTHGPYNKQLEADFARYIGVKHAVSVNSCASALHLAMLALGIQGEVIMPSFTFVATANATVTAGATPVFADICYNTCNIDPAAIRAAITSRTEAIMPVHYGGQACDMDAIMAIAQRYGLAVIEDSAETIGGEYRGKKAGTFGVGCYSFYPTKNMTTGEGGMVVTNDDALAERIRTYVGHGISSNTLAREKAERPWLRAATLPGYNFRLSNIQAALGVGQLARLDEMNARRREHAAWYNAHLAEFQELLDLPVEANGCLHVYQMYTVKLKGVDRTAFLAEL
ncbi:MAG: DegT/DnrJ/EryC1/StrS family aminotransferase, partial [Chloroflexi bacterium]|nr:DegT/DnrJ/EryC1/StrS family aminotransferase [Chloroflexota bacterium]